jgi:hypothetical protein
MLLAMLAESHSAQSRCSQAEIGHAFERLKELRGEIKAAMERAQEANDHAGIWGGISNALGGDVASIAGVIASAAVIAGTGGTGAAVLLAGAAIGFAAAAKVGQELGLDPKLVLALELAGVAAGAFCGGEASPGFWATLATVARGTQGGATAAGGGAFIVQGQYQGDATEAQGEARFHRGEEQLENEKVEEVLGLLEQSAKIWRFESEAASKIQNEHSAQSDAVVMRIGG